MDIVTLVLHMRRVEVIQSPDGTREKRADCCRID